MVLTTAVFRAIEDTLTILNRMRSGSSPDEGPVPAGHHDAALDWFANPQPPALFVLHPPGEYSAAQPTTATRRPPAAWLLPGIPTPRS